MKCFRIIFYIIYLFLFLYSNTILAGKDQESSASKNQENSTSKNNQTLYEYYKNLLSDERIKEDFLQLIIFFNESNVSLNKTICKLILRCDTRYCTKFIFNIKLFFTHEKFKNITIQQFAEWFDGDPQQVIKFSTFTEQRIKKIAMHPLLSLSFYLSNLYKGFGFPNIDEIYMILIRTNRSDIQEQVKIIQQLIALNITDTTTNNQLPNDSFSPSIDELKKSSHLLLTYMHTRHIIVTDRFLLWIGRIPHYLFKRTCKKMIIFLQNLAHPCDGHAIIDMITIHHIKSLALCDNYDIKYIASLEKINNIMIIQQGQGFPNRKEIQHTLEIKGIETMWPRLCTQFKGRGFPTLPTIFFMLKKTNQYDKKIKDFILLIKNNNKHIQWNKAEISALYSMIYFLLYKNVDDILLLSNIFYNVSEQCSYSLIIYKIMKFFSYLDHNSINIRKLSGMLYSPDALQIFIQWSNNALQSFAKYEQSHGIMDFFQEENSGLLKRLTEVIAVINTYSFATKTNDNPELNKQFSKLKIYWGVCFLAIGLNKQRINILNLQWHKIIMHDVSPVLKSLLENNIIIDDRLYAILFHQRNKIARLCKKLTYIFSHQNFSQYFFEFFINLLGDNDNYLKFMECSNEDFEIFLTHGTPNENNKNFSFLKKLLKNSNINCVDISVSSTHQTDTRQRIQLDATILSIKKLLMYKYKNDEQSISFCTALQLLHDPCWKDEKGNFDLHRLCAVSNIFSGECTHPFDSNAISIMLNWDFMQQIDGSINYEMLYIISLLCFGHGLPDKKKAQQLQIWLMMNSADEQFSLSMFMLQMPIMEMGLNIVNKLFYYDGAVCSLMRQHSIRFGALDYFSLKRVSLYLLFNYIRLNALGKKLSLIKGLVENTHRMIPKKRTLKSIVLSMEHEIKPCAH